VITESVKASLPTLKVVKEAFTDLARQAASRGGHWSLLAS